MEGRIAALEAELAALKAEAGDLRQRRSAAKDAHKQRVEGIRTGKAEPPLDPKKVAAAVEGGLGAAHALAAALRGGGDAGGAGGAAGGGSAAGGDAAALGVAVAGAEVPVKLLGAVQQVVELSHGQLAELGAKARFFRERLDKVSAVWCDLLLLRL